MNKKRLAITPQGREGFLDLFLPWIALDMKIYFCIAFRGSSPRVPEFLLAFMAERRTGSTLAL
jgi:hypothetical protein